MVIHKRIHRVIQGASGNTAYAQSQQQNQGQRDTQWTDAVGIILVNNLGLHNEVADEQGQNDYKKRHENEDYGTEAVHIFGLFGECAGVGLVGQEEVEVPVGHRAVWTPIQVALGSA